MTREFFGGKENMIKLERKKDKQKITVNSKVQAAPFIRAGYEIVKDAEKAKDEKKAESDVEKSEKK